MRRILLSGCSLLLVAGVSFAAPATSPVGPRLSPLYEPLFRAGARWTYAGVHRFTYESGDRAKAKRVRVRFTCSSQRLTTTRPDLVAAELVCKPAGRYQDLGQIPLERVYLATARGLFVLPSLPKDPARLARALSGRPAIPLVPKRWSTKTGDGTQREEASLAPKAMTVAGRAVSAWCSETSACIGTTDCTSETICLADGLGIVAARAGGNTNYGSILELLLERTLPPVAPR